SAYGIRTYIRGLKKAGAELKKLDNTLDCMLTNSDYFILRAAKPRVGNPEAAEVLTGSPAAAFGQTAIQQLQPQRFSGNRKLRAYFHPAPGFFGPIKQSFEERGA
ncbi:MAG TPA: hypothetical protein VNK06_07195, partial [Thermodesulfobacteriota bacterium]|nr:hypothetical protein [Thermodesulfobacteriota bacterium]